VRTRGRIRCRFDPPLTFQGVGNAVCQAPAGLLFHFVRVFIIGDSSCQVLRYAYLANGTQVLLCPAGGCTCASLLFDAPCGSFNGRIELLVYHAEATNSSYVDSVLQTVGIGSINTLYGEIVLGFGSFTPVMWPFTSFSSLQVARPSTDLVGGIYISDRDQISAVTLVPGGGFSQLIAAPLIVMAKYFTDLQLLSSLQCAGYIAVDANLVSLTGLDKLSDGITGYSYSSIAFDIRSSTRLTNITALSLYGKCGTAAQLPSTWPSLPYVKVAACAQALSTWPAVCNYIVNGTCS
jgi:hypothetical protein